MLKEISLKNLSTKTINMDEKSNNLDLIQKKDKKLMEFLKNIERLLKEKNNTNFDIKEVFFGS